MRELLFILILGSNLCFGQNLPDLGDSIIIYKYANSTDYQLVIPKDSSETLYYSDSTKKAIGKFFKHKRNGNWSTFYNNGTIKTFGYITDSSFYGKWKFYYNNGAQKAKGKFKHTLDDKDSSLLVLKMSGKWKFWDESGKLLLKANYSPYRTKNKALYGKYKTRYDSGKLKTTGEYHKGSKIGTWNNYHENGKKQSTKYYQYKSNSNLKDYPIGIWLYWNEKGVLIKKETYKNGVLIDTTLLN